MSYRKVLWLLPLAASLSLGVAAPPSLANCPGAVPPLEVSQPRVQANWEKLQQMETYPWGTQRIYERLEGDRITLSANFDQLRGPQKQEAINLLQLGNSSHRVYASDGRLLSAVYDGCTRFETLTEKARYSWYYNEVGRSLPSSTPRDALRNYGTPTWRFVQVPIGRQQEQAVRNLFWKRMGYSQVNKGMWIAWVPERGYFEINVPNGYNLQELSKFWQTAPRNYRYVVLSSDGTPVFDANFDT